MILCEKSLQLCFSKGRALTRYQFELLGEPWPTQKGWLKRIIGQNIPDKLFIRLKNGRYIDSKKRVAQQKIDKRSGLKNHVPTYKTKKAKPTVVGSAIKHPETIYINKNQLETTSGECPTCQQILDNLKNGLRPDYALGVLSKEQLENPFH